jgi:RNA polymerase I-specific transcription initiation factor RRN3
VITTYAQSRPLDTLIPESKKYPSTPVSETLDRIHSTLKKLLTLVPAGPSFLVSILTTHAPHKTEHMETHVSYTRALLRISTYAPTIRHEILQMVMDVIVLLDVTSL